MVLVSIDPSNGDTALISVPRNLQHLPFPPGTPLADRFPTGFNDLANAVYPFVDTHRDLAGGGDVCFVGDAGQQGILRHEAQGMAAGGTDCLRGRMCVQRVSKIRPALNRACNWGADRFQRCERRMAPDDFPALCGARRFQ